MNQASITRRVTVVLGLALLLAWGWVVAVIFLSAPEPVRTPQMQPPQLPLERPDSIAAAALDAALQRPLFWSSRRPVAEVVEQQEAPAAQPQQPLDDLVLLGVLLKQPPAAIVRHAGEVVRLQANDELQGWTLQAVYPDRIELAAGGQIHSVPLRAPLSPAIQLQ